MSSAGGVPEKRRFKVPAQSLVRNARVHLKAVTFSAPHANNNLAARPLLEHDLDAAQLVLEPAANSDTSRVGRIEQIFELAFAVQVRSHRSGARACAEVSHHADSDALGSRIVVIAIWLMQLDVEVSAITGSTADVSTNRATSGHIQILSLLKRGLHSQWDLGTSQQG